MRLRGYAAGLIVSSLLSGAAVAADLAVRGGTVWTMAGEPIVDGVVLIEGGRIAAVGPAESVAVPAGTPTIEAPVVTPGLIDARSVVGLTGVLNQPQDQDQLERSDPIQPELRAIDAYNGRDELVGWLRSFGITTVHTGHAPGELVSGQTLLAKTWPEDVDRSLIRAPAAIAATLGSAALKGEGKSPGTRAKQMAMLRSALVAAQRYADESAHDPEDGPPKRDLGHEALAGVLSGEVPLMIAAHRAQDIASSLRLAEEFGVRVWIDGGAESYLLADRLAAADVPVLVHPTMARGFGDLENLSFETAARLTDAGVLVALQGGYESYVPKVRVVLFEAALAAANGLGFERALASITIDAARLLGIDDRVGSIETGKDADLALYDGDPFEYVSHCVGVVIDGSVVSTTVR